MRVCVIGGGAAGMMAAYTAAKNGADVCLYEKNEKLGKKVYITGKGRCNLTNACSHDVFLQSIVRNPKFMYSALAAFSNRDMMELCESRGLRLKVERGDRVYPVSDKASDVTKMFEAGLKELGVKVRLNTPVLSVETQDGAFTGVVTKAEYTQYDGCVVATGGLSYPATGSTGDGYVFARACGLSVVEPRPALIPLVSGEPFVKELAGVSLKNVGFALEQGGKAVFSGQGEMLFTHFGVSGPLVLSASSYIDFEREAALTGVIDIKPGLSAEKLEARILRDFDAARNKEIKSVMGGLTVKALAEPVLKRSGIDPEKRVNSITAGERRRLTQTFKRFEVSIDGTRPIDEAVVTRGGVSVRELNARTMECKKVRGLYFCGETVDVDALTGGFNLQLAFSTGYCAGLAAAGVLI